MTKAVAGQSAPRSAGVDQPGNGAFLRAYMTQHRTEHRAQKMAHPRKKARRRRYRPQKGDADQEGPRMRWRRSESRWHHQPGGRHDHHLLEGTGVTEAESRAW